MGGGHPGIGATYTGGAPCPTNPGNPPPPAVPSVCVTPTDDLKAYFNAFEQMATAARWERITWAAVPIPCLIGLAQQAVDTLAIPDLNNYDKALLGTMLFLGPSELCLLTVEGPLTRVFRTRSSPHFGFAPPTLGDEVEARFGGDIRLNQHNSFL